MLWEIWGQHKWSFAVQGLTFVAALLCVFWKLHGASDILEAILTLVTLGCFGAGFLNMLTAFGYVETNSRVVQIGYPHRLLLKPVSTARLALVPMFVGGAVTFAVLLLWLKMVLRPLDLFTAIDPIWLGVVTLSFFWWMQALAWSMPLLPGRALIVLTVTLIHLAVGLMAMPDLPVQVAAGWRWMILSVLLLSAVLAALSGLKLMRRGTWESPSRLSKLWSALKPARSRIARKKFGSAFQAQFWLEWRRQGLLLPGLSAGVAFTFVPLIYFIMKKFGDAEEAGSLRIVGTAMLLITPLALSGIIGTNVAKFDQLQGPGELPVYIAVRPMTNGGFIIAKLAMALASSTLTWLLEAAAACFWIALLGKGPLLPNGPSVMEYGPLAIIIGCVPALLLLILFTWKNLMGGIGAGLTGRKWFPAVFTFWRMAAFIGLVALLLKTKLDADFKGILLHWLTWILATFLVLKIALSVAAFYWGIRRNAITRGAVGWIAGGWILCGLFVAGYAGLVCVGLNKPEFWIWAALAGFLLLPLADLAIAPLALAWNRHR
jgi:hypothetical protein